MEIKETYNYDLFVFDKNRPIDAYHLTRLRKDIRVVGYVKGPQGVITVKEQEDGKLWIFDGQHRFLVCKDEGLPVRYHIDNTASPESLSRVQRTKSWSGWDYIGVLAHTDGNAARAIEAGKKLGVTSEKVLAGGPCDTPNDPDKMRTRLARNIERYEKNAESFLALEALCPLMLKHRIFKTSTGKQVIIRALEMGADKKRLADRLNTEGLMLQVPTRFDHALENLLDFYNKNLRSNRIDVPIRTRG